MFLALVTLFLAATLDAQTPVFYRVAFDPTTLSTFTVSVAIPADVSGDIRLLLPNWSPHAWRPSSWGERIQSVKARDGLGNTVGVTRNGDVLEVRGRAPVTVTIQMGQTAQGLGVTEYFTNNGVLVDGTRTLPLVGGASDRPCTIEIDVPESWDVACPLEAAEGKRHFRAADYPTLVDAPIMAGSLSRWTFEHGGIPHDLVLDRQGKEGRPSAARLLESLEKTAAAHEEMLGKALYKRWTLLMVEGVSGERQHRNALTVGVDDSELSGDALGLLVQASTSMATTRMAGQVRPAALVTADPFTTPKTPSLWFTDGWPRWAGRLALLRAGAAPALWRGKLCDVILSHRNHSLVGRLSPADASRTIAAPWRGLDPGLAGHATCAALDIQIRHATGAKKSLSDVVRLLIEQTDSTKGFTEDQLASAVEAVGGASTRAFFVRHTETVEPIPWDDVLAHAGLQLEWIKWQIADPTLRCSVNDGKVLISRLRRSSALYAAGARVGDTLVTVNQRRVRTPLDVDRQIARMRAGQKLRIDVRRGDRQRSFRVTMATSYRLRIPLDDGNDTMTVRALPPGPARDAGLAEGDILLKIDNMRIGRERHVRTASGRIKAGKAALTIIRRGNRKHLTVKVPRRVIWRGAITLDPKAKPDARRVRDALLEGS